MMVLQMWLWVIVTTTSGVRVWCEVLLSVCCLFALPRCCDKISQEFSASDDVMRRLTIFGRSCRARSRFTTNEFGLSKEIRRNFSIAAFIRPSLHVGFSIHLLCCYYNSLTGWYTLLISFPNSTAIIITESSFIFLVGDAFSFFRARSKTSNCKLYFSCPISGRADSLQFENTKREKPESKSFRPASFIRSWRSPVMRSRVGATICCCQVQW